MTKLKMDVAKEFEQILKKYGRDVLFLRTDRKLYCECYNEVTQEASRECPVCLGLGWSYIAERQTVKSETSMAAVQLPNVLKGVSIGDIATAARKYFVLPSVQAKEKDLIVEVGWDDAGRPYYNNNGMWNITYVDKSQFLGDQEIFRICYVNEAVVRTKIRGIRIAEINGVKQYSILMEE
ncbi:hypothetical protein ABFV99_14210 [Cytobacillus horneckiae]|uniref:hypothetical protein n=1 Tax=Cytobacillus horneckiae TaxID=549687 RepID=UPI0034CE1BB6